MNFETVIGLEVHVESFPHPQSSLEANPMRTRMKKIGAIREPYLL